jgi:RluA family pseudouridine synthase
MKVVPMPKPIKHHSNRQPRKLTIIYEDDYLIVVDKPAGLLTVGTEKEKANTLYFMLTDYVRKGDKRSPNRIFIVHRLDREASGILVFAKTEAVKRQLQDHWENVKKKYLVVVHGKCTTRHEVIESYLAENKAHHVYSTDDAEYGKLARTAYKIIKTTKNFSLLEIDLLTGRKHQIRVHMADMKHPVVGDKRYGIKDPTHNRLALHAMSLTFKHPVTGAVSTFETSAPAYIDALVGPKKNKID